MKLSNLKLLFFLSSFFFITLNTLAQSEEISTLGYQKLAFQFEDEHCEILLKSKLGEEKIKKPLLLYFQGSLARPLIVKYPEYENYLQDLSFPFDADSILNDYHVAVISKPFIPALAKNTEIDESYSYVDSKTNKNPIDFLKRNNLDYLSKRNNAIVNFLRKKMFIDKHNMVILGHSEGSRITFEVAKKNKHIAAIILLSGNPFGRYMNIVQQSRSNESNEDFLKNDTAFDFWNTIENNKEKQNFEDGGHTYASWFAYSKPYAKELLKLEIPVFIGYGTKDDGAPYFDLFQLYASLEQKQNFVIKAYLGLDHSFYQKFEDGHVDHEHPYFTKVVLDALNSLK